MLDLTFSNTNTLELPKVVTIPKLSWQRHDLPMMTRDMWKDHYGAKVVFIIYANRNNTDDGWQVYIAQVAHTTPHVYAPNHLYTTQKYEDARAYAENIVQEYIDIDDPNWYNISEHEKEYLRIYRQAWQVQPEINVDAYQPVAFASEPTIIWAGRTRERYIEVTYDSFNKKFKVERGNDRGSYEELEFDNVEEAESEWEDSMLTSIPYEIEYEHWEDYKNLQSNAKSTSSLKFADPRTYTDTSGINDGQPMKDKALMFHTEEATDINMPVDTMWMEPDENFNDPSNENTLNKLDKNDNTILENTRDRKKTLAWQVQHTVVTWEQMKNVAGPEQIWESLTPSNELKYLHTGSNNVVKYIEGDFRIIISEGLWSRSTEQPGLVNIEGQDCGIQRSEEPFKLISGNIRIPHGRPRKLSWQIQALKVYEAKKPPFSDWTVHVNGKVLSSEPSLKVRDHSPTGFAWGYAGSGPAQLALAILLDYSGTNIKFADMYHQQFKFDVIANLPRDEAWSINSDEIDDWIRENVIKKQAWQLQKTPEKSIPWREVKKKIKENLGFDVDIQRHQIEEDEDIIHSIYAIVRLPEEQQNVGGIAKDVIINNIVLILKEFDPLISGEYTLLASGNIAFVIEERVKK